MGMPINRHGNDAEEVCQRAENKADNENKAEDEIGGCPLALLNLP